MKQRENETDADFRDRMQQTDLSRVLRLFLDIGLDHRLLGREFPVLVIRGSILHFDENRRFVCQETFDIDDENLNGEGE